MERSPIRVVAVVVTYRCDLERLGRQFERLLPQVEAIVCVDNGAETAFDPWLPRWPRDRIELVRLRHNVGIAAAQNLGLARAQARGATHVLLMDHDSVPATDMVPRLLDALHRHADAAAVGPCYDDQRLAGPPSPFFIVRRGRIRWLPCEDSDRVWEVDHVIASGCLIPVPVLRRIGGMREDFFIDWVDVEWCWRAREHGLRIYGACGARLQHRLGDQVIRLLGRDISLHPPWRHYYQARNWVLLLRCRRAPLGAKLNYSYHQARRFLLFCLLVPGRFAYLRMWLKGLRDGLANRAGMTVVP